MNVRTPAGGDGSLAQEWRGGWSTLLGATGAVAAGSAAFTYTASFFVKPLEAALGWSRAEIAFGAMLGQVTIAAAMPVAGWLTDRFGARIVALAGFVAYGLFCLALAAAPATLPVYYALLVGVALACGGTSAVVFNPLVVACFKRSSVRRSMSLAIALTDASVSLARKSPASAMAEISLSR